MVQPISSGDSGEWPGVAAADAPRAAQGQRLLLTAKYRVPPPRPDRLARPDLAARLDAAVQRTLTLIIGPPGFGKTTLLSDWCARAERPVAWLSLDAGDNDPARFWAYVVAALATLPLDLGDALLALEQPTSPSLETLLTLLLNAVGAAADEIVLVLDNYQAIEAEAIHRTLAWVLDHAPPRLHLVIATRAAPRLPLARPRARGQLTEFDVADLRFEPAEAGRFLREVMGLNLPEPTLAALVARAEGWPAGLQLAGLALRGRPDLAAAVDAVVGVERAIEEYLVEEVLAHQPPEVQDFLGGTAILEQLTGGLCDALTGRADGQAMLERLERARLFLTPLDAAGHWYRYHPLFADVLRARWRRLQPAALADLHRRAADWYERQAMIGEAIGHALAAGDGERAARLAEELAEVVLRRGEATTMLGWLDALPADLTRARPRLALARAGGLLVQSRFDAAEEWLAAAEAALRADTAGAPADRTVALLGQVDALRATVAINLGEVERTIALSRRALASTPAADTVQRGFLALNLGDAYARGGAADEAASAFAEAIALCRASVTQGAQLAGLILLTALGSLGELQARQGRLHQAAVTFGEAIQLAAEWSANAGRPVPWVGKAQVFLAAVRYEWNDLEGALQPASEGVARCAAWGHLEHRIDGTLHLAAIQQARGDHAAAATVLAEADGLIVREAALARLTHPGATDTRFRWLATRVAARRADLWLARGELAAAVGWAETSRLDGTTAARQLHPQLTLARVLIAHGHPDRAAPLLETLRATAEARGWRRGLIAILALQALAAQGHRRPAAAVVLLAQALELAEPEGFQRTFIDLGAPLAPILRQALAQAVTPGYTRRLLAAVNAETSGDGPARRAPLAAHWVTATLSERERAVLRLVAAGRSNQEIAEALFVSVNTIKTHLRRLYDKLDATSRVEAIEAARQVGWL